MAKKKKSDEPVSFEETLAQIQASVTGVTLRQADEVLTGYNLRRKFGIPSLDIGLRGGIPAGTLNQLYGPEGSGKDYLVNRMIAELQKTYGDDTKVFIASFGYKMDRTAMLLAGVHMAPTPDLAEMGITADHSRYGPQIVQKGHITFLDLDQIDTQKHPAEAVLEAVLSCVRSGVFQLGIINELPAAETGYHKQASLLQDARVASLASLMADFQRKFYNAMKSKADNETTIMVINQVRANMRAQGPYSKQTSETGGFALKHLKAADVHIKPVGRVKNPNDKVIGKEIGWKIEKGKCGLSEGAEGSFEYLYETGADIALDILKCAVQSNIMAQAGSYYYLADEKFQGKAAVKEYLSEPENLNAMYAAIMAANDLDKIRYK